MKNLFFLWCTLIFFNGCFTQGIINTEKMFSNDSSRFLMIFEPNIDYQRGNTNVFEFFSNMNLIAKLNSKNKLKLIGGNDWILEEGQVIINDNFAQIRFVHDYNKHINYHAFSQIQSSTNLMLENRLLLGNGFKYNLLYSDSAKFNFSIGFGAMYENEILDDTRVQDDGQYQNKIETSVYRYANFNTVNWAINNRVNIVNTLYYQPMINKLNDYRILNDMDLLIDLNSTFTLNLNLVYRYDSITPDTLKNQDIFINIGFVLGFNT